MPHSEEMSRGTGITLHDISFLLHKRCALTASRVVLNRITGFINFSVHLKGNQNHPLCDKQIKQNELFLREMFQEFCVQAERSEDRIWFLSCICRKESVPFHCNCNHND